MQEMQKEIGGYEMVLTIRDKLIRNATEYNYKGYNIKYISKRGWAIFKPDSYSFCYDEEEKDFCLMPQPSNRDFKFYLDCMFTLQEAVDIVDELDKHEI